MKVSLHIVILRNPQVDSSIRSSICLSLAKDDGHRLLGNSWTIEILKQAEIYAQRID